MLLQTLPKTMEDSVVEKFLTLQRKAQYLASMSCPDQTELGNLVGLQLGQIGKLSCHIVVLHG